MEDKIETNHLCLDCGKDTRVSVEPGNYYVLHRHVWEAITTPQERRRMLCVACASERLGRPFTDDDFLTSPVEMVARLLDIRIARMTDAEKRHVMDTYEEHLGEYPEDIRLRLSMAMMRLFG
jgi:hypothetical protein